MVSNRLLIVSNRLPVTARVGAAGVTLTAASGGLATGLRRWHETSNGLWIGWPGDVAAFAPAERDSLERQLADRAIVPVYLSTDQIDRYYHGFANRVLWPLFHYLIDRVPVDATGWDAYQHANEAFADRVWREYRAGDTIWVHDYQLMLVPALLRQRLPDARIGFFLHIPFPSSEVFRILPWRREILRGLLGADLVGFHTFAYLRHFVASLLHVDGVEPEIDRVRTGNREVRLGVFPMGVDATRFSALAQDAGVIAEAETIRRDADGRQIVLGVDRLDYTKGIPRRLHAVERLLASDPKLRDSLRFIQVAVPSREEVDSYQRFKRQVEESVGRINGTCATLRSTPVHYIHDSVSMHQLVALYCAADVMLVTPLRDGMNLVAKEFVASRVDERGVLVLSEFAGAAAELDGAIVVNPYDCDAVAESIKRALAMPPSDCRARMRRLRRRVQEHDVTKWACGFLEQLASARATTSDAVGARSDQSLGLVVDRLQRTEKLHLLLDYDGTLLPLMPSPDLAAPDDELLSLLAALARTSRITVDIVSGRPWQTLDAWLGHLPLSLWAEHGFWRRPWPEARWHPFASVVPDLVNRVGRILQQFTVDTPGSELEVKSASIAWHYRRAHREFGARQAHELRMLLGDALSNQPFEVLDGRKVIEVRLRGVSKAVVGERVQEQTDGATVLIAIGDDRTDEDLFRTLPASSITIAVGKRSSSAKFQVADYRAVREILRSLLANGPESAGVEEPRVLAS